MSLIELNFFWDGRKSTHELLVARTVLEEPGKIR